MILETATGKLLQQCELADPYLLGRITFSPDGKLLAAGGWGIIRVWEVGSEKAALQFDGHRGRVTSLAFHPDGKRLASASEDCTALVWDLAR
jgi:WD40 repeat protein